MMSAFSPGLTRQRQLLAAKSPTPAMVIRLLSLLAITYILIQMQEKYTKIIGNYRLTDRVLGHGSFSQVLLAYSAKKRPVAAKVIPRDQISESEMAGFESEVEILRSLKHENIVELLDFKKSQKNFYLMLEYCEGGNLAEYLRLHRKLPEKQAMRIFKQILQGMSAMHQFKIVHRDLKPANILFKNGRIKIADFGLARKFSKNQMLRTFAGTPFNMAPEILRGNYYNQKVDVYSAGTVLYQMLYGSVPFKGRDQSALLESIQKGRYARRNQQVSERTQNLLKEMLSPKPEDRIELTDILDIVSDYQSEMRNKRLQELRDISRSNAMAFGAPGGLSCGFQLDRSRNELREMDQRLYSKFCRKLSAQVLAQ